MAGAQIEFMIFSTDFRFEGGLKIGLILPWRQQWLQEQAFFLGTVSQRRNRIFGSLWVFCNQLFLKGKNF